MCRSDLYCQYPLACITLWIEPAIAHDQIHFFFDKEGDVTGYITWAHLAADTEVRLLNDPNVLFHISEWNEGDRLWLMDLVLIGGDIRRYAHEVMALFPTEVEAKWVRRREDGSIRKITSWKRKRAAA